MRLRFEVAVLLLSGLARAQLTSNGTFTNSTTLRSITTATSSPNITSTTRQNALISLAPNGTGMAYAQACADQQKAWTDASKSWVKSGRTRTTYSLTTLTEPYAIDPDARPTWNCSYECDGHCRMYDWKPPATAIWTYVSPVPVYEPPFTSTKPSCSVGIADCTSLLQSYVCATSLWFKDKTTRPWIESHRYCDWKTLTVPTTSPTVGSCYAPGLAFGTPNTVTMVEMREDCGRCTIFAGHNNVAHAQLMYFPPTTTGERDLCATTITESPIWDHSPPAWSPFISTSPQTFGQDSAVSDGTTFYANSLYIKYPYIEALDNCGNVGPMMTSALVALPSSDLHSQRGQQGYNAYTFNFDDYIKPIPYVAYRGQQRCWEDLGVGDQICGIMDEQDFSPQVVMPQQVRTLHSDWGRCTVSWNGVMDPPIALHAAPHFLSSSSVPVSAPAEQTTKPGDPPTGPTAVPGKTTGPGNPQETGGGRPPDTPPNQNPGGGRPPNLPPPNQDPGGGRPVDPPNPRPGGPPQPGDPSRPGGGPFQPGDPARPGGGSPDPSRAPNAAPQWTSLTNIGGETLWVDPWHPGSIRIGEHNTLKAGDPVTNIGGVQVTLDPAGLIAGSSSIALPRAVEALPTATTAPPEIGATLTLDDGEVITAGPSGMVVGSSTLKVGDPGVIVDGKTISLGTGGVEVIDPSGTSTAPFSTVAPGEDPTGSSSTSVKGVASQRGFSRGSMGFIIFVIVLACT